MIKTTKRKTLIKLVFGLALLLFIGWKLFGAATNGNFQQLHWSEEASLLIGLSILLMPLNWLAEGAKWHILIRKIKAQRFQTTLLDVLSGVSTSLLTPNRIGNFIGRTITLEKHIRTKAIIATIHANLAQFAASIIFGVIGLVTLGFESELFDQTAVYISATILICLSLLLYFQPKVIDIAFFRRFLSEQAKSGISFIQKESVLLKITLLLLSAARYFIFLVQFYLLLLAFNAQGAIAVLIPAIAVVYLITTVVPSVIFGKLFVREASALFVLHAYGVESVVILAAVFLLWIINLALPAVFGAIILMKRS